MNPLRLCVLISGSGTNLQALIDARDSGQLNIEIVHVISNVADAAGLDRACKAGIPTSVLEQGHFADRQAFDQALALLMATHAPDLFVFAGFMRIVGKAVIALHRGRMINLHPSLLPLYPGLNTYQRALDAGDEQHGASMHFLTEQLDGGPLITQVRIPIKPADSVKTLAQRLAPREHHLITATVELFCTRRVEFRTDHVSVDDLPLKKPLTLELDNKLNLNKE